jgi:hypothetical protein
VSKEADLSGHGNAGTYANGAASAPDNLNVEAAQPRVVAQSRMMQLWDAADEAANNVDGQIVFRTEVTVLTADGLPRPATKVRIWADEPTTVTIDGVPYTISPTQAAALATNGLGRITLNTIARSRAGAGDTSLPALSSRTLEIWADFMADFAGEPTRVIIHPDDDLYHTLLTLQGGDLSDPANSKNPVFQGKSALYPNASKAGPLAQAISRAAAVIHKPTVAFSPRARVDAAIRGKVASAVAVGGDCVSEEILLGKSEPDYARSVAWPTGSQPWEYDFATGKLTTDAPGTLAASRPTLRRGDPGADDLWAAFVNGTKKALSVAYNDTGAVVHVVDQFVEQQLTWTLNAVAEAGEAMYGILCQAVGAGAKIIDYFAYLFNWTDIVYTATHTIQLMEQAIMTGAAEAIMDQGATQLDNLLGKVGNDITGLVDQFTAQLGVQSNWFFEVAMLGDGPWLDMSGLFTPELEQKFKEVIELIQNTMTGSKTASAYQALLDYLSQILEHPAAFFQLSLAGLAKATEALLQLAVGTAATVFDLVFQIARATMKAAWGLLSTPIKLPLVSWLWSAVVKADTPLTAANLICLVGSIPATTACKVLTGKAPYQQTTNATVSDYNDTGYSVMTTILLALDMFLSPWDALGIIRPNPEFTIYDANNEIEMMAFGGRTFHTLRRKPVGLRWTWSFPMWPYGRQSAYLFFLFTLGYVRYAGRQSPFMYSLSN